MSEKYDIIIIGAGIVGLSIARDIISENNLTRILIIEKEDKVGCHSSGRNSGVLHSGIYYPSNSLKAKVCSLGAKKMSDYCEQNKLPIKKIGKVIVPSKASQDKQLDTLHKRGIVNGAKVEIVDQYQLKDIEPEAYSVSGKALYSPHTSIIEPKEILFHLIAQLENSGVTFLYQTPLKKEMIKPDSSSLLINNIKYQYKTLYNAAGLFADKIAHLYETGLNYTLLPFKGSYYQLSADSDLTFNGLIYPVPDLNQPFLGVHSVKSINNSIYFGPSALPAWGRENYYGFDGVNLIESSKIGLNLVKLYGKNNDNFRNYFYDETKKLTKTGFCQAIQPIIPSLNPNLLETCSKVGIRAQLLNTQSMHLEMDFIVQRKENTIHVLNAVSPAFTSAFEFAHRVVTNQI